jgi:deoxyribodipyrimidine photolyase
LQDLSPDGLKSFLDAKGVPLVVEMNKDPANHAALVKFFNGVGTKVFLFLDLKGEGADEYRTAYHNLAKAPHPKVLKFLIADAAENENALKASFNPDSVSTSFYFYFWQCLPT